MARRRFGNVRRRSSGRWQARYPGPDGRIRSAPETFERKADAQRYLTLIEAQMVRGEWIDPARAAVALGDYAERWIAERPGLSVRTGELYESLLRLHIKPDLGGVPLGRLDPPLIREWRAKLLDRGTSPNVAAKAYRLLRAVLMTAVNEDGILPRNPCRVPGADKEEWAERPVLTVVQLRALVKAMPGRFRAMVLLATFASLRFGEITALERQDLDVMARTVRVRKAFTRVRGKGLVLAPPKSRAGVRVVDFPRAIVPALSEHLAAFVGRSPASLVFTGPKGAAIQRQNFNKLVGWKGAVASIGVPELHFHDLRHTGNHLAAATKASTRDLMARMGHDSVRAALIYQHATSEAGRAIADALDGHWPVDGP